jgi:hypothetical protein
MSKTATRTDPDLWERVKKSVIKSPKGGPAGKWSARKAQIAVALYKKSGGRYKGKKSEKNSLVIDWGTLTILIKIKNRPGSNETVNNLIGSLLEDIFLYVSVSILPRMKRNAKIG